MQAIRICKSDVNVVNILRKETKKREDKKNLYLHVLRKRSSLRHIHSQDFDMRRLLGFTLTTSAVHSTYPTTWELTPRQSNSHIAPKPRKSFVRVYVVSIFGDDGLRGHFQVNHTSILSHRERFSSGRIWYDRNGTVVPNHKKPCL